MGALAARCDRRRGRSVGVDFGPVLVGRPECRATDLSALVRGKRVNEDNGFGPERFVKPCSDDLAEIGLDLIGGVDTRVKNDEQQERLAFELVGDTDRSRPIDGGMIGCDRLDLGGPDGPAGDGNDVVGTAQNEPVTVPITFD